MCYRFSFLLCQALNKNGEFPWARLAASFRRI